MAYSYGTGFILQGLYFVLLGRWLGSVGYGVFAGAFALAAIAQNFSGIGAGNDLVMRVSRDRKAYSRAYGTALSYLAISAVILTLACSAIAAHVGPTFLSVATPVLISEILFTRLADMSLQVFQSHDRIPLVAHGMVMISGVRLALLGVAIATLAPSALAWAIVYSAGNAATALLVALLAVRLYGRPRVVVADLTATWRRSVYFSLGTMSRSAIAETDKFLLSANGMNFASGNLAIVSKILTMGFTPIQAATYSSNTRLFRDGEGGHRAVWGVARKLLLVGLLSSSAAAAAIAVLAGMVSYIMGPGYELIPAIALWYAPTLIWQTVHYVLGDALMGVGRQRARSLMQFGVAVCGVGASMVAIPRYGWVAAAILANASGIVLAVSLSVVFVLGIRREGRASASAVR